MATGFDSGYPGYGDRESFSTSRDGARFRFGNVFDTTQRTKSRGVRVDMPLYAWASVIVGGRVVATDYAPDTGWLLTSPDAEPGDAAQPGDVAQPENDDLVEGPFPMRLSMTIPGDWTEVEEPRFYHARRLTRDDESTGLRLVMVDTITKDPCAQRSGAVDGRATVDDLVALSRGSTVDRHLEDHRRHVRWLSRQVPRVPEDRR